MQVKSIAKCPITAITPIAEPFHEATICHLQLHLYIFEWSFYTGFTVYQWGKNYAFENI